MDVMNALVRYLSQVTFDDLPSAAVSAAKKSIMDTVGVMVAGSSVEGCQRLVEYLKSWGGPKESTIAVFGGKTPAFFAALANGAMARAWEIDDVSDEFVLHPSVSVIPAGLAVAERQGGTSGQDLITAVAVGQDLMFRMAASIKESPIDSGRYNLFRVFASTATAGKLLALNEEQMRNALGIAYSQLSGDGQSARDGVMMHYIQSGVVAKSAIEAALLAEIGVTGSGNAFQGPSGFFQAIEPNHDLDPLVSELGAIFRGIEICVKQYPSCRLTHESIDLALDMVKEHDISPDSIEKIIVHVNDQCYNLVCQPLERKRQPRTFVDAQFSLPYTVAAAIAKRDVFINELSEKAIKDEQILKLAQRVTPTHVKECNTNFSVGSTVMEIKTSDGKSFHKKSLFPKGNPNSPLSINDYITKLKKCVGYSKLAFQENAVEEMIEFLSKLDEMPGITRLMSLLSPNQIEN